MSTFNSSFKRRLMAEINVVPYIDVMLVLLVVFVVAAPLLMQGVEVDLPESYAQAIDEQSKEPVIASIKANGEYFLNVHSDPDKAMPLSSLQKAVARIVENDPTIPVLVWGDKNVAYGKVVELMGVLQEAGVPNVGLVTEEEDSS